MNFLETIRKEKIKFLTDKGKYPTHIVLNENQFIALLKESGNNIKQKWLSSKSAFNSHNGIELRYCVDGMAIVASNKLTDSPIMFCDESAFWLPSNFCNNL